MVRMSPFTKFVRRALCGCTLLVLACGGDSPPARVVTTTAPTTTTTSTTTTTTTTSTVPETTSTTQLAAAQPERVEPTAAVEPAPIAVEHVGLEPCGGDLPPCWVKWRESHGDYTALNRSSGASGAWQFLDSTWAGHGGYSKAMYAPPDVQDERAREVWNGGAGCSHWSAC